MQRFFAAGAAAFAMTASFQSSIQPLPGPVESRLKAGGFWKKGCPVGLSDLRLLTVSHVGWRGRERTGRLVVHETAAPKLRRVFRDLHAQRFPIRHMRFEDMYGPWPEGRPGDVTGAFECRRAAASPCNGYRVRTGSWSNHAYGLAIDINPRENPYVGCGMSHDRTAQRYRDRSRHRKGMVTRRVVRSFAAAGWEWGGSWSGDTKDWMHFSHNGH